MQVIKTHENNKYFCPMKDRSLDNNRCDGPKCMWWSYDKVIKNPDAPIDDQEWVDNLFQGYCDI